MISLCNSKPESKRIEFSLKKEKCSFVCLSIDEVISNQNTDIALKLNQSHIVMRKSSIRTKKIK